MAITDIDRRLARKQRNQAKKAQRRQESECFWTWPFGHVWSGTITSRFQFKGTAARACQLSCYHCGKRKIFAISKGHIDPQLGRRLFPNGLTPT